MARITDKRSLKGQVLLFVLFTMLLLGILSAGLSAVWQTSIDTYTLERDNLKVFYLAQAAVERAKIDILNDVTTGLRPGPAITNWYSDLDDGTDNFTYQYRYSLDLLPAGTERTQRPNRRVITGIGELLDGNSNMIAHKEIMCYIDGLADGADAGTADDDMTANQAAEQVETFFLIFRTNCFMHFWKEN